MKRLITSPTTKQLSPLVAVVVFAIAVVAILALNQPTPASGPVASAVATTVAAIGEPSIDPTKTVGMNECKTCHVKEFAAWEKTAHNGKSWALLADAGGNGPKIAAAMGIADRTAANSLCVKCHATPNAKAEGGVEKGTTCESCHGEADGWLKKHADMGGAGGDMAALLTQRKAETAAHRADRDAACKAAGMNRSMDAMDIAMNCMDCHLVTNQALLNKSDHPINDKFEFVEYAQGEIRHNYLLSEKNADAPTLWLDELRHGPGRTADGRSRVMRVAGEFARLVVALKACSTITSGDPERFGKEMLDQVKDALKFLTKEDIGAPESLVDMVKDFDEDDVEDMIKDKKGADIAALATKIEAAAKEFLDGNDGSKIPEVKMPRRFKGDPQP